VVGKHAEERLEDPEERKRVCSAVKRNLSKKIARVVDGRSITPLEATAQILAKLKRDAEDCHFHEPVTRAVITCPAVFDEVEKDQLCEAARRAGFRDVALLEEPVAAAHAYTENGIKVGRHVLVYDLGGGTFDLAWLAREEGEDEFRLAMEPRGKRIGGEDFDRAIYDYFEAQVSRESKQPICSDGLDLDLLFRCRRLKESLSASEQSAPVAWHGHGKRLTLRLDRACFEGLVEHHVELTVRLTRSIQEDAETAGYPLESVILIGGASRTPCIIRRLHETLRVEPRKWEKQDVAVALGAAYHAQRVWGTRPSPQRTPPESRPPESGQPAAPADPVVSGPSAEAQQFLARARDRFNEAAQSPAEQRRQHLEAAQQFAQAASDLAPGWAEPFQVKGRILEEKKDWLLAVAAYTAGLQLDPGAAPTYVDRGLCRFMTGNYRGATEDFEEGLRLAPTELTHRYRAAAHCRMGNAAAAVTDIQNGLRLANQDTPRAALHAVIGLLLRNELHLLKESIAAFAESLRLLPAAERALERQQFVEVSTLFDLASMRMAVSAVAETSNAAPFEADASAPNDRLKARVRSGGRFDLVAWVQERLWQASKALHGDGTRAAAAEFVGANSHETDEHIWKAEPELALHLASIWAEKQNPGQTLTWLKNLLAVQPQFDTRLARGDRWIGKLQDSALADFLTPRWSFQEEHGKAPNWLGVTNLSPFRLTALEVRVFVTRSDGMEDEPKIIELESLNAGASQHWPKVFQAGRRFGGNISRVRVELHCAEDAANPAGFRRSVPVGPGPGGPSDVRFALWEGLKAGDTIAGAQPLASRWSRLAAVVIDVLAILLVYVPGALIAAAAYREPGIFTWCVLSIIAGELILAGVQIYLLFTQGQTIGKKIVGVRIVKLDGGNPGFVGAVLLRTCVPLLISVIPFAGQVFFLVDILYIFGNRRRCLHDRLAGTIVVKAPARDKAPQQTPGETSAGGPPLASRRWRLAAVVIDVLAIVLVFLPGWLIAYSAQTVQVGQVCATAIIAGWLILACVQIYFLFTKGQTIGKKLVGVRIVKLDGRNPGFVGAVLLRTCVPLLISVIPVWGQVFFLVNILYIFGNRRRCLHDRLAGTIVVKAPAR
jgi:uncharacterized RDD family membrane protein YckC/tetratricopeptide (TPR) repeat protein